MLLSRTEKEGKHETQKYNLYNQLRSKNNLFSNRLGSRNFLKTLTSLNVETTNSLQFFGADRGRKHVREREFEKTKLRTLSDFLIKVKRKAALVSFYLLHGEQSLLALVFFVSLQGEESGT